MGSIALEAARAFAEDRPFQLAAALSYYTLLSIAPLLLVITGAAGVLVGEEAIREALIARIGELIGREGADLARTVISNADAQREGVISVFVGSVLVLIGASTIFAQLQVALNRIWHVRAAPSNALFGFIRRRLLSLSIVFGIGFLLWVSLLISAMIEALYGLLAPHLPVLLFRALNTIVSIGFLSVLLALLFKYVPDVRIEWRDTWAGAVCTAVLFTVGKFLIGLYLGRAGVGSAYGAAGSAIVVMVWVYYSSLILFFGAELTQVLARRRGRELVPSRHATQL